MFSTWKPRLAAIVMALLWAVSAIDAPGQLRPLPPITGDSSELGGALWGHAGSGIDLTPLEPPPATSLDSDWTPTRDDNPATRLSQLNPPLGGGGNALGQPDFAHSSFGGYEASPCYEFQVLGDGLMYKAYLAGVKESRLAAQPIYVQGDEWLWDLFAGGQFSLLRYGTKDEFLLQGYEWAVDGSAHVRLDPPESVDLRSTDYRVGTYFAHGFGRQQVKFGYYHLSSHVGDEFLLKNPGYPRLNYSRDVLILGYSIYPWDNLRLYAEAGWAFHSKVAKEWEFQFGLDYAPAQPTGIRGAPFLAINGHVLEELDYGGALTVQTGWAWRADESGHLLRIGMHYYNGGSPQYSFYNKFEHQLGLGVWYDF